MSACDFEDFPGQVRDAIRFLRRFGPQLKRLRRFPGLESWCLDFGVEPADGIVVQRWRFPEVVIALAATVNIELELSTYLAVDDDRRSKPAKK